MGKIRSIKESQLIGGGNSEEYIYPVTSTKAIYSPAEKSQETINNEFFDAITELTKRIVELENKLN